MPAPSKGAPSKGTPSKGAPAKGTGNQSSSPAPAPKTNEKLECPRCYPNMDPFSSGPTGHELPKCSKGNGRRNTDDKASKLWPKFDELGDEKRDKVESQEDAAQLLEKIPSGPTEFKGKQVTKYLLEHAFRVAHDDLTNTVPKKSAADSVDTGRSSKLGIPPSSLTASNQRPTSSGSAAPAVRRFNLTPPPQKTHSLQPAPEYEYAVHQDCSLDQSLMPIASSTNQPARGSKELIATNYVAVSKVPKQLHMYSISYGTIESMASDKKDKDGKEAKDGKDSVDPKKSKQGKKGNEGKQGETKMAKKARAEDAEVSDLSEQAAGLSTNDGPASDGSGGRKPAQRSEKSRIFKALGNRPEFHDIQWATDYAILWTIRPLALTHRAECTITNVEYIKLSGRKHRLDHITFRYCGALDLVMDDQNASTMLLNQVAHPDSTRDADSGAPMRITALNALISKRISENDELIPVGPNKFFVKGRWKSISEQLTIRPGYFTSIRPGQSSVLLNINVATSAFYNSIRLARVFERYQQSLDEIDLKEAQAMLKGLTVWIAYERVPHDQNYDLNHPDHRHRIVAGFGATPHSQTFELEGQTTTVAAYFAGLGHDVQYPELPCISVNVAPSRLQDNNDDDSNSGQAKPKPQWIPPELLYIDPYQPYGKLLPTSLTHEMIKQAVRAPSINQDKIINEGFDLLGIGPNSNSFSSLQLHVGDKLLQVPAVLLPAPNIRYRHGLVNGISNASWNLRDVKFFKEPEGGPGIAYPLRQAVCTIDLRSSETNKTELNLGLDVSKKMRDHGIRFDQDISIETTHRYITVAKPDWKDDIAFHSTLEAELDALEGGTPRLAIVLLSEKNIERYGVVKRVCDQWLAVHTVCVTEKKLKGGVLGEQQKSNLALKFNLKLRGENHHVCKPKKGSSAFEDIQDDTIVFGADVSHAGSSMPNKPSVAAVVASEDGNFAKFSASMRLQRTRCETITDLSYMVRYRLLRYHQVNGRLPTRILFFRDGVSEDQFEMCKRDEIPRIEHAYQGLIAEGFSASTKLQGKGKAKSVHEDGSVRLTFVVVGKRHNTRFYATSEKQTYENNNRKEGLSRNPPLVKTERTWNPRIQAFEQKPVEYKLNGNVKPGLLVDQVITRPKVDNIFDFFLQSHAALQGTARAGHYSVLEQGDLSAEQIQDLTHAFCYNYARATKGVSYVGPAYYADRLCERGTHYLRGFIGSATKEPFDMDEKEANAKDKKEAAKQYATQIADHISEQEAWNPQVGKKEYEGREPNPWHPHFDNTMFWL